MARYLTGQLAELAPAGLRAAVAGGEGFEIHVGGAAVRWRRAGPPREQAGLTVWEWQEPEGPLRARALVQTDAAYRAARYHVEVTNTGDAPVVLDALWPLVVRFPGHNGPWRTLSAGGGTSENFYPPRAYAPRERLVFGGQVAIESPPCGRSSQEHLPFLLATTGFPSPSKGEGRVRVPAPTGPEGPPPPKGEEITETCGFFAALEYSGGWFLALRRVGDSPFLRGGLKAAGVVLAPGEMLALPAAHVGFFAGGLDEGTNALRRYIRDCVCPTVQIGAAREFGHGRSPDRPRQIEGTVGTAANTVPMYIGMAPKAPLFYNHWFGIEDDFDEPLLGRQVARAAALGCEYWVHDAGWHEGGYPHGVGNWRRADPARYPRGLKPLADRVRSAGMGFGLWFDIERAEPGTWAAEAFPQLFFPPASLGTTGVPPVGSGTTGVPPVASTGRTGGTPVLPGSYHLNLTRPDAQDWAAETISRWVTELALAWLRLDYSLEPAPYFAAAGGGRIELDYYAGLCRVLDGLRRAHGQLVIELSAGGGRRLDLAMLRRGHVAWLSDQTFNPDICRYMQCRASRFLPGHLTASALAVPRGAVHSDAGILPASPVPTHVGIPAANSSPFGGGGPSGPVGAKPSPYPLPKGEGKPCEGRMPSPLAGGTPASLAGRMPAPQGDFGDVDILSRMCGALGFAGDVAAWPAGLARRMLRWVDRYKSVRHLLASDFHQLLPTPVTDRDWDAVQFSAGDGSECIVFAFRMAGAVERMRLPLAGIDPQATYSLANLARPGRGRTVPGAELAQRGLLIRLAPESGVCIHIQKQ